MEVERWGVDEEVVMDVDLTLKEEEMLMMEISDTRSSLALSTDLPSILDQTTLQTSHYNVR